ncbi:MAG: AAA family ATPase [Kribbellaceae bacterium]|nr:AAA family ATPase [Kribbellaceae bacterium]
MYLTGTSGVGKTTVGEELRRRGYVVYDVDVDGLARWYDDETGVELPMPDRRDDSWYAEHTYRLPPETVRRLAPADGITFITGAVGNEDQIWDLFDLVIQLTLDAATLEGRLRARGSFGSSGDELARVLAWQRQADLDNVRYGARPVSADGPPGQVADLVLGVVGVK